MTKKQFAIIFTLMALIVCVGVLSMKLNESGATDPTDLSQVLSLNNDQKDLDDKAAEETLSTNEYFYSMRLTKSQQDDKYISDMKAISEDPNIAQEQKDIANNALIEKSKLQDQESRVELDIKSKGYEDAICMIDEGKVKVYVKVTETLSAENSTAIKKVVQDITSLNDVTVTSMK